LGSAPPSNAYLSAADLQAPEKWFPLRVRVCGVCWLVQTEDYTFHDQLFAPDYAYFSSFSTSWLDHARRYVDAMIERFQLDAGSKVVEIAANDGYLLQYVAGRGIPCLGVEPTASTAAAARAKGLSIVEAFFGTKLARELCDAGHAADLTAANNVLAHVPNINDFAAGFATLLKPTGVATFEFPHLLRLVQEGQFDTIYHEHFSYLSLGAVQRIFEKNGLSVFSVEEIPTHGGSLRVYAQRKDRMFRPLDPSVAALLRVEADAGMNKPEFYSAFQARAESIKNDFVTFLIAAKREGKRVAAYGAAAKGNTLLNFAGIKTDLIDFVVDRNPAKRDRYLPGSRIPILGEDAIAARRPDYVVILPWNLRDEVMKQLAGISAWGGRFVWAVPKLTVQ
jgi:SAM-dependent methyltransferase